MNPTVPIIESGNKNVVIKEYNKLLKKNQKEKSVSGAKKINRHKPPHFKPYVAKEEKKKLDEYESALKVYEEKRTEREELRKTREMNRKKREEAIQRSLVENVRRKKIFEKKTRRGQPIMAGRMELLLERIQKCVSYNN